MNTLLSIAKTLLKLLVAGAISLFVFLFAMGFANGPWGVVPGGSFAETSQPAPANWSFAKELDTVEFQLEEPVSSRTSWIMVRWVKSSISRSSHGRHARTCSSVGR